MSSPMELATTSLTSASVGQMSLRWTGLPSWSTPSASVVMSTFMEPARA